jgi:hypothetical protein
MLPLIMLLFGVHSGGPPRMTTASQSTESVSAVDIAAARRLGRVDVASGGATVLSLAFGEENPFAERPVKEARQIALAARWIDALPFKVDARDGGVLFALRVRGP